MVNSASVYEHQTQEILWKKRRGGRGQPKCNSMEIFYTLGLHFVPFSHSSKGATVAERVPNWPVWWLPPFCHSTVRLFKCVCVCTCFSNCSQLKNARWSHVLGGVRMPDSQSSLHIWSCNVYSLLAVHNLHSALSELHWDLTCAFEIIRFF